ncbi:hypothetical protein [Arsenicibacter rosenii]|uniref:Uncharacterized protein n=1 Tax=Arsenicibacter rosenii TaxID=1750698 RepID=A0A1S2VAY8_9BACT|nr:hypothetical protein [Arsenicibacter rosenii]OIN55881.1 hypothetical protein BLX24_27895 [Arsenicibacter rosenii]
MITCLIDDIVVHQPEGIDGLRLTKTRNRRYMGWLYRKLGTFPAGAIRFTEPKVVNLLRTRLAYEGMQAETGFTLKSGSLVLYDSYIDYSQYNYDGRGVSISTRDRMAVSSLEANATTTYSLTPVAACLLHSRALSGSVDLTASGAVASQTVKTAAVLTHTVPLAKPDNAEDIPGTVYETGTTSALHYLNTSDQVQTIRIAGQLRITATANTTTIFALKAGGVTIGRYSVGTSATTLDCVVDVALSLSREQGFVLQFVPETAVSSYSFTYNSGTLISLGVQESYADSTAMGFTAYQLLATLIDEASGGKLKLNSSFFQVGDGANIFLTSGANLRGVVRPVRVSLQQVFEGLSALVPLQLTISGSEVIVEDLQTALAKAPVHRITELLSYRERPDTDRFYNSIRTGYQTWKAESKVSELEVNSERRLATRNSNLRNELNLTSALIASGTLIEEVRRIQFQPDKAGENKSSSYDDSLFVIATVQKPYGRIAEKLERTQVIDGLIDAGNSYNLRFTPMRNLSRWAWRLAGNGPLTVTDAGTQAAVIGYDSVLTDESEPVAVAGEPVPMRALVTTTMSMAEYEQLEGWLELPDGRTGLIMSADWQHTATGDIATIDIEL